jgi:hypothetical protein
VKVVWVVPVGTLEVEHRLVAHFVPDKMEQKKHVVHMHLVVVQMQLLLRPYLVVVVAVVVDSNNLAY